MASALVQKGLVPQAVECYTAALQINPHLVRFTLSAPADAACALLILAAFLSEQVPNFFCVFCLIDPALFDWTDPLTEDMKASRQHQTFVPAGCPKAIIRGAPSHFRVECC